MPYVMSFENNEVSFTYEKSQPKKRQGKGKSLISLPEQYVVIDLETTGFSAEYDEIIEVAAMKIISGAVVDVFQSLIKPKNKIDEYISELTGITNEMVSTAPNIEDMLPKYLSFIGDNVIVGHNVSFDVNFIYDVNVEIFGNVLSNDYVDTLRISRKLYPDMPHHRLIDISQKLNITQINQHRALGDCETTFRCFEKLKEEILCNYDSLDGFVNIHKTNKVKLDMRTISTVETDFDETHPLFGKHCVFTGELQKMKRADAAQIVVNLGGICDNGITKKTNFLILGNNDYCKSIKDGKSTKQKKAEEYRLKGFDIEILSESAFYDMIEN